MNWRQEKRKRQLKGIHPTIQDKLAVAKRISKGEEIVDGGFDRNPRIDYNGQCESTTLKGVRCKRWTRSPTKKCVHHRWIKSVKV